jgi:hypothetical protein
VRIFAPLEAELKGAFPYWVELSIPTFAIQPGTNWEAVRNSISLWLRQNISAVSQGHSKHEVPDVPFPITIDKSLDMPKNFLVARIAPSGEDDKKQLVNKFCAALSDKNEQLQKYRDSGAETILLVESDDVALVSLQTLYRAFLLAWEKVSPPNICQFWTAHSYVPEDWCKIVCFLGPKEIMDTVNPANYCYGPLYRDAWFSAMRKERFAGIS